MTRLSVHELQFRGDADRRLSEADALFQGGSEADRGHLARLWREAGHALINAADAIAARLDDEGERHGNR